MGLDWAPAPSPSAVSRSQLQKDKPVAAAALIGRSPAVAAARPIPEPPRPAAPQPASAPPSAASAGPPVTVASTPLYSDQPLIAGSPLATEEKLRILAAMDQDEVRGCTKCRLCEKRTHTVFGDGDPNAKLLFIGEGPGAEEDRTGQPFVGRSGALLDRMLHAMGLSRQQVYITNIVKCRPPGNRAPMPDEVTACTPYLIRQLEIIRPRVIVTLGLTAAHYMLANPKLAMRHIHGRWFDWRGIKLLPTYHPSYVLRSYTPEVRRMVWGDLQQVMKELELPIKNTLS